MRCTKTNGACKNGIFKKASHRRCGRGFFIEKSGDNAYVIQNLTFLMDYTATNSFGGRVRKQEERSFKDISYTVEFKYAELSEEVLLEVLNATGVDEVFGKIEEYYQSVLGGNK